MSINFQQLDAGYFAPIISDRPQVLSYPEIGNENSRLIEENSHWFSARNEVILKVLKRFPFPGDFLDLGGGNGFQLSFLQKNYFRSQGIRSAMCEPGSVGCTHAAARGVDEIYCCLHQQFPFADFQIGGIGLFDVIEHIDDDIRFLQELEAFLPFGSRIYITVPALRWLWSKEDDFGGHFRRFQKADDERLETHTNLRVIHSHYFFSYYVLPLWLLRVFPEKLGIFSSESPKSPNLEEANYHKNSQRIQRVLNTVHTLESKLISIGIKPIVGTSRLIVLEKKAKSS